MELLQKIACSTLVQRNLQGQIKPTMRFFNRKEFFSCMPGEDELNFQKKSVLTIGKSYKNVATAPQYGLMT